MPCGSQFAHNLNVILLIVFITVHMFVDVSVIIRKILLDKILVARSILEGLIPVLFSRCLHRRFGV